MDLAVVAIAFGAIFVVELPDKTFIATLVLSTRYRGSAVWAGVGLAFAIQSLIAVTIGHAVALLPDQVVSAIAAAIFTAGAVLLLREAIKAGAAEADPDQSAVAESGPSRSWIRAATASFLVLFAAEWGDLSQLLTISLVGRYHDTVGVFLGAWGALLVVSGLAVLAGQVLLRHVKLSLIQYVGAAVCLVLAVLTVVDLLR